MFGAGFSWCNSPVEIQSSRWKCVRDKSMEDHHHHPSNPIQRNDNRLATPDFDQCSSKRFSIPLLIFAFLLTQFYSLRCYRTNCKITFSSLSCIESTLDFLFPWFSFKDFKNWPADTFLLSFHPWVDVQSDMCYETNWYSSKKVGGGESTHPFWLFQEQMQSCTDHISIARSLRMSSVPSDGRSHPVRDPAKHLVLCTNSFLRPLFLSLSLSPSLSRIIILFKGESERILTRTQNQSMWSDSYARSEVQFIRSARNDDGLLRKITAQSS